MSVSEGPLTCLEMVARVDGHLDRQLDPHEIRRVEAHLANCLRCAHEYRFEAHVLEGIRERMRRIALPEHLRATIRARLTDESGTIRRPEAL
jgi:anti-sigma factor (TIGR02949 family)